MKVIQFFKDWSNKCKIDGKKSALEGAIEVSKQLIEIKSIELEEKSKNKNFKSIAFFNFIVFLSIIGSILLTGEFQILAFIIFLISSLMTSYKVNKKRKHKLEINKLIEEIEMYKEEIKTKEKELSKLNIITKEILRTLNIIEKYDLGEMLEYEITIPQRQINFYLENQIPLFAIFELIHSGKIVLSSRYKKDKTELDSIRNLSNNIMKQFDEASTPKYQKFQLDVFDKIDNKEINEEKRTRK